MHVHVAMLFLMSKGSFSLFLAIILPCLGRISFSFYSNSCKDRPLQTSCLGFMAWAPHGIAFSELFWIYALDILSGTLKEKKTHDVCYSKDAAVRVGYYFANALSAGETPMPRVAQATEQVSVPAAGEETVGILCLLSLKHTPDEDSPDQ